MGNGKMVDGNKVYNETTRTWEEFNGEISSYVCYPRECGAAAELIHNGNTMCRECARISCAEAHDYAKVEADHE